ncbi:DIP1281 family NlpC/P60 protein [Corynebacterium sp.]|uniref:DIP1281 family NlpC/P60 protein n=1 Tax=Corynebacterium sp. TaxID=1720 RepID=UPI00345DA259
MALRLTTRGRARGATARGTGALLAVAVTAGLTTQASPAMADETTGTGAEAYLADLVARVSAAEDQVNALEGELGGLRESVNKSRVDFDQSTRDAQDAQDQVTDARSRLGGSEDELGTAQADLDEISRSAYAQGGDASAVPLAAGSDADDAIDRATYIRMAAERQQAEVDRLDLARTQAANEESSLREARDNADSLVAAARQAQDDAQAQFEKVQQDLASRADEHTRLLADADIAREQLAAARAAVDRAGKEEGATSFDKRRAAETAVSKIDTVPAETTTGTTTGAATETASEDTGTAGTTDATAAQDVTEDASETTEVLNRENSSEVNGNDLTQPQEETTAEGEADASTFSADTAGDERRQAAIDGLLDAAGAAAVAGFTANMNGEDPLAAAADAAQSSAAESYGSLPEATSGDGEDTGVLPGTGTSTGNTGDTSSPDASGTATEKIDRVIDRGMSQLGVTYAWGGGDLNGPTLGIRDGGVADAHGDYAKVGFDCSGLMMYAFNAVGIQLQHYSGYQYTAGKQVPVEQAQRGDMLFWGIGGSGHVALYLGDGKMLEAPQSGDVVKVSDVRWSGAMPYAVRMIE